MSLDSPAVVLAKLHGIERDLESRQNEYETAAADTIRVKREYELRKARALVIAEGRNKEEREANALIALAVAEDGIYTRFTEAEATLAGMKAAIGVLDSRASIAQSILRSQGRVGAT